MLIVNIAETIHRELFLTPDDQPGMLAAFILRVFLHLFVHFWELLKQFLDLFDFDRVQITEYIRSCFAVPRLPQQRITVAENITHTIRHERESILGIQFYAPLFNHIKVIREVALPVDGIIFVVDDFLCLLDEGPDKLIFLTLLEHFDGIDQETMLVVEDFFFEGDG